MNSPTPQRQPTFQRNPALEELLQEINRRMQTAEEDMRTRWPTPTQPVILVVGAPRSGTTLTMQWLAQSGQFAYPTNLLSRFYAAPYLGSLIQRLLTDPKYQYGNELDLGGVSDIQFQSNLGKTRGLLQPNEFWYFWRRFFPIDQAARLSEEELAHVDAAGFAAGIAALQAAFQRPWAMKGILLQFNLAFLTKIIPNVLFIFTRRSLLHNAQSLYQARIKYYGNPDAWFSVQPPGHDRLLARSAFHQVVGQVEFTNQAIRQELDALPQENWIELAYEDFCAAPAKHYQLLKERVCALGGCISDDYTGEAQFPTQTAQHLSDDDWSRLSQAMVELTATPSSS